MKQAALISLETWIIVKTHTYVYSDKMTRAENLLKKAINNPRGLSFKDFQTMMRQNGWQKIRHDGSSHQQWSDGKDGPVISIQNLRGKAKEYQVIQFLKALRGGK